MDSSSYFYQIVVDKNKIRVLVGNTITGEPDTSPGDPWYLHYYQVFVIKLCVVKLGGIPGLEVGHGHK